MPDSANRSVPYRYVPENRRIVTDGVIVAGDMVWDVSHYCWQPADPSMIRDEVDAYHGVAR